MIFWIQYYSISISHPVPPMLFTDNAPSGCLFSSLYRLHQLGADAANGHMAGIRQTHQLPIGIADVWGHHLRWLFHRRRGYVSPGFGGTKNMGKGIWIWLGINEANSERDLTWFNQQLDDFTNINILWVEERSLTHMFSWKVAGHPTETVQVQWYQEAPEIPHVKATSIQHPRKNTKSTYKIPQNAPFGQENKQIPNSFMSFHIFNPWSRP